jgi:uncharacterized peroxidase-related enzyme
MPHIALPEGFPGISGPMVYRPETAKPLNELAQALLRGHDTLTAAECELIATYVSSLNDCYYCQSIHGAIAAHHLKGNEQLVLDVKANYETAEISDKLRALLAVARKVWQGGKQVTPADIEMARQQGATDLDIHDTVLIAPAFCMYNRYVDGLATWQPRDADFYRWRGAVVGEQGYLNLRREAIATPRPAAE